MDELVAAILSATAAPSATTPTSTSSGTPTSESTSLKALLPTLRQANVQLLTSLTSDGRDPLFVLDPTQHSLGYLFILAARVHRALPPSSATPGNTSASKKTDAQPPPGGDDFRQDPSYILSLASTFAQRFARDQVAFAPKEMTNLGTGICLLAERIGRPAAAIKPLRFAVLRWSEPVEPRHQQQHQKQQENQQYRQVDADGVILTSLHPMLMKMCLLAKNYKAALPVLDRMITDFDKERYDLKVQDWLLYMYYGGMVYVGCKAFDRALDFFQLCVTAPAQVASAIQIEAYRKYVLVSILLHGRFVQLPKYVSNPVTRACRNYCAAYTDFAQAYESLSAARVSTELSKHQETFAKHRNLGLARQCLHSLIRKNIQQLTQTYLTLSLGDIARTVGLGDGPQAAREAERYVVRMVEEGQVFATVSQREGGMVSFHDSPGKFDDMETLQKLDADNKATMVINDKVLKMDRWISTSRDYLSKIVHGERGAGMGGGMGALGGFGSGSSFDDEMFSEDVGPMMYFKG
ncbi:hypothetical protein HK102_005160 [Quaeritorhiza haematococci]|nr:hypothetical protein HK102_005160 [Quaeritorhiza haematococci]